MGIFETRNVKKIHLNEDKPKTCAMMNIHAKLTHSPSSEWQKYVKRIIMSFASEKHKISILQKKFLFEKFCTNFVKFYVFEAAFHYVPIYYSFQSLTAFVHLN